MEVERRRGERKRRRRQLGAWLLMATVLAYGAWDITDKARYQCKGLNQLREFQGQALELQILQTQKSLATPGGLKELESFRPLIRDQQAEREKQLLRLRDYTSEFPVAGRPYTVNCAAAHPLRPSIGL